MCEHTTLIPIPDILADYRLFAPEKPSRNSEYGINEKGEKCFAVDECIATALLAVWAAGYRTLGCCCGHGQAAGGIITLDTMHGQPVTETQKRYAALHQILGANK